ncbi:MAG: tRNA pseudouridine(55) synthase TruB [Planctomycetes bacterium]|nr:tRNA pseudouridine(55) synthase TruB [Planctomycetota bacterium]
MDGILLVDKDRGKSSHDIVQEVRFAVEERRAGHTGTLDPSATGLLVVVLGRALKLVPYMEHHDKEYLFTVHLGRKTDTDDASGRLLEERDASGVTRTALETAAAALAGRTRQRPPIFSAIKVEGERAYRRARRGERVELPEREVRIHELSVVEFSPPRVTLRMHCSRGTYVRSVARDLGEALGCGGSVEELRRTAVGPFRVAQAVRLSEAGRAELDRALLPADSGLESMPRVDLAPEEARRFSSGQVLDRDVGPAFVRVYEGGRFLGIGEDRQGKLKARRVM